MFPESMNIMGAICSSFYNVFLLSLDIMPFDEEVTDHYGRIRAYLENKWIPIGPLDMMIAARAQWLGSTF